MKKLLSFLICFLCGAAIGGCLLLPEIGFTVFVLASPAFVIIFKAKKKLLLCIIFAVGICLVGYFPAMFIRANLPQNIMLQVNIAVYAAVCIVHGALLSLALWLGFIITCLKGTRWLCIAVFWGVAEWIIGFGPFAWPTLRVSLALWQYPILLQSANIGGQLLVSVIIIAVNALLAAAFCSENFRKSLLPLGTAVAIFAVNALYGLLIPVASKADIKIAVVQPGVTVINENRGDVYNKALTLTRKAAESDARLIILSESILPTDFFDDPAYQDTWEKLASDSGADILVGGRIDGHSAVYHFSTAKGLEGIYQKVREVPIFENGVGEREFRLVAEKRHGVQDTQIGRVGVLICYESLFSAEVSKALNAQAQLLTVLTNDSWFDTSVAKSIHLAHGIYRAVESGRTLVQAGINGKTAVIDLKGNIAYSIPHESGAVLEAEVSLQNENTVYNTVGDYWLWAFLVIIFVLAFVSRRSIFYDGIIKSF